MIPLNPDQFDILRDSLSQIRRQSHQRQAVEQLASLAMEILAAAQRNASWPPATPAVPLPAILQAVSQVTNLAPAAIAKPSRGLPKPDARKLVIAIATGQGHTDDAIAAQLHVSPSAIRHQRAAIRRQAKLPSDWSLRQLQAATLIAEIATLPEPQRGADNPVRVPQVP